jgi:LacI family transcriptional regulator
VHGDNTPTMKEVASRAGVALSSVSRVLNNHPDVSEKMRRRVLDAVATLGYEPNLVASSLRRGSTNTVGFVVSDISNPLFADFTKGAGQRLQAAGYSMVLTNAGSDPEQDEAMIRLLRWRRVDGLITSLADEHRPGTIAELTRIEAPVVLLDRFVDGVPNASVISAEHGSGMAAATEHLLELGHRRIGLISGSPRISPTNERVAGFRQAFERHGVPYPSDLIRLRSFSPEFGTASTRELMAVADPPTAIISGGNLLLTGVLRALRELGIGPGTDVAIVSCDDVALAELHTPPITVIARDTVHMGETAAEMMLERLASPEAAPHVERVPTKLVIRDSTFPLRSS